MPGFARHFAFSETGQAVRPLRFLLCISVDVSGFPEQGNGLYFLKLEKVTKKFRPLPGLRPSFRFQRNRAGRKAAAVFAFHKRRKFRFLFRVKASHFLVRQESGKEAPGPSVPLKNTNSNANNWRICVFLPRHSDGPGTPTANEVAFSVARETARMTFARSHAARVPENGIWNRAANRAPAVAGEIISAQRLSACTRCEMLACVRA